MSALLNVSNTTNFLLQIFKPTLPISILISPGTLIPFFNAEPYEQGNNGWLKAKDVIVSTGIKSGTTWMLYCSHQVRVKGNDDKYPFREIMSTTPWVDLLQVPGERWEERRHKMNNTILPDGTSLKDHWDHPDYDFRIFKSHLTPVDFGDLIGCDSQVKFLAMARNGLDQAASLVPFLDRHTEEFRQLWGGFPPADGGTKDEKIREVASVRIKQMMPDNIFKHIHFDYVNDWWRVKDEKNVMLLHYSDAKKDLRSTVGQLAKFYEVQLSKEEMKTVVEKCSFKHMKQNTHLFNMELPLNPKFKGTIVQNGAMTRKGVDGQGKVLFSNGGK